MPRTDGSPEGACADARDISVWVVSYLFAPVWAGPAERFLRYGPKLAERGVRMAIVTAMRPGQPRHETKDGIAIERIGHANTRATSVDAFLARAVLRALATRPRPHVMVFLTPGRALPPFLLLLRMKGIKSTYVSTMARLDTGPAEAIRKRLLNGLKRAAYDGFDSLVCSTRALVDDLTVLGLSPAKIEVIPNGVSLSRFRPAKDVDEIRRGRQALGLPLDGPIVLYVGSRVDRKGVIELVEGWQRYRDKGGEGWLVMVGQELRHDPERAPFYERWDRCVATLRASHHVEVRGPHPRIEEYFRAADVVVLLSELEGTPNVIPEAMASGVPVLTTRFRGFSTELGRDGRELVITERDPHAVSQALARLLGDARLRRALAVAGRAWVERHQDLEVSLDAYRALFERLTTTSKGRGGGAP